MQQNWKYLVDIKIILNPISQQNESFEILLRTRVLGSLRRSPIGTKIGCLLAEDSFGLGKAFFLQIIGDLVDNR